MYPTEDSVWNALNTLHVRPYNGTVCIPFSDVAHALCVEGRSADTLKSRLESLESAGKVTLLRTEPGLVFGILVN